MAESNLLGWLGRGSKVSEKHLSPEILEKEIIRRIDLQYVMRSYFSELYETPDNVVKSRPRWRSRLQALDKLEKIRKSQEETYKSYIHALGEELMKPSRAMYSKAARVSIILKTSKGYKQVNVDMGGGELSQKTKDIKDSSSKFSKTFWKHTGRTARAYRASMKQQLSSLKEDSFMSNPKEIVDALSKNMWLDDTGRKLRTHASVEIKVPKWKGKDGALMDDLITKPYAGIKPNSMYSYLKSSLESAQERAAEARNKKRQDDIRKAYASMKAEEKANRPVKPAKAAKPAKPISERKRNEENFQARMAINDHIHAERWARLTPEQREAEIPF